MKAMDLLIERREMGVTQEEARKEADFQIGTLTDIERGRIGVDEETYQGIREAIRRVAGRKAQTREGVTV